METRRQPAGNLLQESQPAPTCKSVLPAALQATLCGALPEQRIRALKDFIHDKTTTVLTVVMSTGGGAAGLTLTVASTVFLLEPHLNIGLETQAAGRVHRLGGLLAALNGGGHQPWSPTSGVTQMIKCCTGTSTRQCKAAAQLAQGAYAMLPCNACSDRRLCPSWHSA